MPRVVDIKIHFGELQAKLLNQLFDLPARAQQLDISMSATTLERLGPKELNAVKAAEGSAFAEAERARLKTEYIALDLELRAALEIRLEEIERELSPKNVGFRDFASAAEASPEALIVEMDMALSGGDENAALLAFAAGRRRDLDDVVAHAITVNEAWGELFAELSEAANDLGIDPGDKWEVLAPPPPSKYDILHTAESEINFFGGLR
jgi:hypothetical protein